VKSESQQSFWDPIAPHCHPLTDASPKDAPKPRLQPKRQFRQSLHREFLSSSRWSLPLVLSYGLTVSIYIFCDNSNIFIEGQWAAGRADGMKGPNTEFRIDYGQLLSVCAGGRRVEQAKLYGSVPPANDSLWRYIQKQGWNVKTMERNLANKEKGLDLEIALDMNDLSRDVPAATMLLLAGDGDYLSLIPRLQQRGWKVEIAFYQNVALSIRTLADCFIPLEDKLHEFRMK
jgi:uncharacterized LabA/DUF88 family protein